MKTKEAQADVRRPDNQGRIVIGKEFKDEIYSIEHQKDGVILLRPVVVIDKREAWLFQNQEASASVRRGMEQSAAGDVHDLGDFSQYDEDDAD